MHNYENDDIKVTATPDTVTIWYKKSQKLIISKFEYIIHLNGLQSLNVTTAKD